MLDKKLLKKLEIIVFDLDGTLLNEYGEIGEKSIEYIHELKKMGMKFSFATGRLHNTIVDYASQLGLETPLVSLDGAIIKSYPSNKIVYERYIKSSYVNKAIKMAEDDLLKVALSHDEAIYYTASNSLVPQLMEKYEANFSQIDSYEDYVKKTLEIIICGDYKKSIKKIEEKMKFPSAIGLRTSFYKSQDHDSVYFLEIRNKKCSKGDGFLRLLKHLKVNIKKSAVLGDWYNDKSLFRTKALKIAMANAVEEIKSMADYTLDKTNNEDGVSDFLKKVIDAKKE